MGLFWGVSMEMSLLPKTSMVGFFQYCPKQTLTMKIILNHIRTRNADQSSPRNHVLVIFRKQDILRCYFEKKRKEMQKKEKRER